jgi:hypothetical protein
VQEVLSILPSVRLNSLFRLYLHQEFQATVLKYFSECRDIIAEGNPESQVHSDVQEVRE